MNKEKEKGRIVQGIGQNIRDKDEAAQTGSGWTRRGVIQTLSGVVAGASLAKAGGIAAQDQSTESGGDGKFISIDGNRVYVEDRGSGIPIVMAAGGQNIVETLRPLAEKLAQKYRVITFDRANLGRADVVVKGARDLDLWSDQVSGLIAELNLRPAYVIGASSAARVAYTTALRYPDHCRGLLTYLTTGGGNIGERLAERYYYAYARLAEESGMAAVAETEFWADRIARNPANAQRILSMEPKEFAVTMRRWGGAMRSSDVMIGLTEGDCARLKQNGTPIAIVQGCEGAGAHRRDRSELYAQLTGGTLIPTPAGYCEEETTGPKYDESILRDEVPESPPFRAYEMATAVPDFVDGFIQATEARYQAMGLGREAFTFNVEEESEDA